MARKVFASTKTHAIAIHDRAPDRSETDHGHHCRLLDDAQRSRQT